MFEQFVDLVHARLAADPQMHVYHYGTYENAALKQLMGTYATREDEVDELLRRNVFVDLHTVVRQGLRAGVDSYSLKEVEALAAFARRADVKWGWVRCWPTRSGSSPRRGSSFVDRGIQRRGLPRDACATRLACRAPSCGQVVGGGRRAGRRRKPMTTAASPRR